MSFLVHLIYLVPIVAAFGILIGLPARRTSVIAALIVLVSAFIVFSVITEQLLDTNLQVRCAWCPTGT